MTEPVDLLAQEYLHLQGAVEAFDDRILLIKGWSVTVSLAGLTAAVMKRSQTLLLISGLSAVLFWFIETLWKSFAATYNVRVRALEEAFRNGDTSMAPFQIVSSWPEAWQAVGWSGFLGRSVTFGVALPHAAILLVCLGLFVCNRLQSRRP